MSVALACAAISCSSSSGEESLEVDVTEQIVERRIDGNSPFWEVAPYLFEGPFTCPIPTEAREFSVSQAHEYLVIQNTGAAGSFDISLEGKSLDLSLSAEPLLLVYAGSTVPDHQDGVTNCLGIAKPGGGESGSVTVNLDAGEFVTAIALEPEIGPAIDGSGSGTFRWRVRRQ